MNKAEKKQRLFLVLGSFFLANAIIAEFVGVKIFSLEQSLGFSPAKLMFFGHELSFNMTAGALLWPFVFIMTDIINEYFGKKGVRTYTYISAVMICYAYAAVWLSMESVPATFWIEKKLDNGTLNMDMAFDNVFGQGLWIIIGSLVAFLIGQLVDVMVFHRLKRLTGSSKIWLRATGSTVVSQLVDSFVVIFIAFYIGKLNTPDQWPLSLVLAISVVNYLYKVFMALALTPLLYLGHAIIDWYLGKELAHEMTEQAHHEN